MVRTDFDGDRLRSAVHFFTKIGAPLPNLPLYRVDENTSRRHQIVYGPADASNTMSPMCGPIDGWKDGMSRWSKRSAKVRSQLSECARWVSNPKPAD